MKQILCFVLLLGTALSAYAQDVITTRKGTVIQAKVTEVTPTEVKYKRFDNLDGPNYSAKKSEIASIVYKNGTIDAFGAAENSSKSASENNSETASEVRNEVILGVNGGFCFPIGEYGNNSNNSNYTGNAESGNAFGLDLGSNFKGSRFGWLLTGFLTHQGYDRTTLKNAYKSTNNNSSNVNISDYSNSGILLGATYTLPLKNRSALAFSLQLGHLGAQYPNYSIQQQLGDTYGSVPYQRISISSQTARGGGFLVDLGASYRLHFPKTHFYMLGKLNYQTAGVKVSQYVSTTTELIDPRGSNTQTYLSSTNTFSYPYSVLNLQFGCGFFLK
jgi:hypothetical protein